MTLSSADNAFKQFGPRSGPTFCPDLIGVKLFSHLRGYDKLKLNQCILTMRKTFTWHCHLLITLSNNLDPDQAQHSVRTWWGSNCSTLERLWQVEVELMYFNYALNFYVTLSSADNPFKQFGPRSGPTICPDLIGVQTVWHFRGFDRVKLNTYIFTLC